MYRQPSIVARRLVPGLCAVALLAACWASLAATDDALTLWQVWHAALQRDPTMAAAQASREVGRARGAEGRALWLPTLSATGGVTAEDMDSRTEGAQFSAPGFGSTGGVDFRTHVTGGTGTRWALIAEQPLLDAARLASSSAQADAARIAEAQFHAAEQELILRSAKVYFDVLNARAALESLTRLHAAAETTREQAQARYDAGDIPITDMREAQANADAIAVQELDARSALSLSEAAFTDLTGLDPVKLRSVKAEATADLPATEPLSSWTQRALDHSPQLAIGRLAVASAAAQVKQYDALNAPRVSLVAQVGRDYLHGGGQTAATDITTRDASVGVQISIPLFTGGLRSAQHHEAEALQHEAEAQLDGSELLVRQQTRAAWLELSTAAARVQALQRLQASAASRLDATRVGAAVGGRTALELLMAEADYQRAGADFTHAQSEWFLAQLRLKGQTGELSAADLQQIDQRLEAGQAGAN